jgi:hypothetical protein
MGHHPQVAAPHRRAQEAARRVPAQAARLVHLKEARALVRAVVEIIARQDAEFLRPLLHRAQDVPAEPLPFHPPFAARAVHRAFAVHMILGPAEIGQHVVPAPARIAQLPPVVIVGRLPAHVDHAVDRRTAAQHLAPRIAERTAVQPRLGAVFIIQSVRGLPMQ